MSLTITLTSDNNAEVVSVLEALSKAYPTTQINYEFDNNVKSEKVKATVTKKSKRDKKPKDVNSHINKAEAIKWAQYDVIPPAYRPVLKQLYKAGGTMSASELSETVNLNHHKLIGIFGNMSQRANSALPNFKRGKPSVIKMKNGVVTMASGLIDALNELPVDVNRDW